MWFDKKAWRLRRKIKDLQADLKEAEKEGRYVLEDGLFFAELEDMGEMTMLVFGSTDLLTAQEESVIRSFFERNGFTVHKLKLDRSQSHLAEVEIIPPSEIVRHVARRLKGDGYKVLDDTARETPSDLSNHVVTLSGLVRALVVLFCEHVQKLIATSRIKQNKEGNRLLHWMPKIAEALRRRITPNLEQLVREYFPSAYAEFYGHLGSSSAEFKSPSVPTADKIPSIKFSPPAQEASGEVPPLKLAPGPQKSDGKKVQPPTPPTPADMAKAAPPQAASESDQVEIQRLLKELDTTETVARMYRKLVRAQASRCVRNAQALLEEVNRLFRATASCLLVKVPRAHGITIHAQAGKELIWGEHGRAGFPVSTSIVAEVIRTRKAVNSDIASAPATESMIMHSIEAVAAAPVFFNNEIVAVLYVDRRESLQPFDVNDLRALEKITKVFEEFPDLTLGLL